MTASSGKNRWTVVIGAVMIQLCLGAVYAWSLFNQPLIEKFGWTREAIVLTFSITIGMFALSAMVAGRVQDIVGPRKVATAGTLLIGLGTILTSFASELWHLYVLYGVIGGAGIGTAYVTPLATCLKWYPDKRGTIAGIAIVGMGLGGTLFKPVIVSLLGSCDVSQVFLYLGIIYLVFILVGAQFLRLPPAGYVPEGWTPPAESAGSSRDFALKEMLGTKQFYTLWFMFLVGCTAGLMVIGIAKDIGVEYAKLTPANAANIIVSIAIANASGRLFWGFISDKAGRKTALFSMYAVTTVVLLLLAFGPMNMVMFYLTASLIGFGFGGFLAVFPTVAADFYGTKNLGMNYGVLYLAYGVAAFVGPALNSSMDLKSTFISAAVMSLLAALATLTLKKPQ